MRRLLAICLLLLISSCGGGGSQRAGSPAVSNGEQPSPGRTAGALKLQLDAVPDGARWRVNLTAPQAADLYQIAGTLEYDQQGLRIVNIEAGGGLGGPEDAYFLSSTDEPGRIDFAYTMRLYGPGASGSVNLVSFVVESAGGANLSAVQLESAFTLPSSPVALRARDSQRRYFAPEVVR
jgi:hypothetical protein